MKINRALLTAVILIGAVLISGCNTSPAASPTKPGDTAPATPQAPAGTTTPSSAAAKTGDTVQVNYTGKLSDGTAFDSSAGRDPLQFVIGGNQVITGFENAVIGMKVGEKKTVTIPSSEAYGPPLAELIIEVNRNQLPSNIVPEVGKKLQQTQNDGSTIFATITKVSDTKVTLDTNHPLAGKDLIFEIELVKIL